MANKACTFVGQNGPCHVSCVMCIHVMPRHDNLLQYYDDNELGLKAALSHFHDKLSHILIYSEVIYNSKVHICDRNVKLQISSTPYLYKFKFAAHANIN
jgi:hypothetical protein